MVIGHLGQVNDIVVDSREVGLPDVWFLAGFHFTGNGVNQAFGFELWQLGGRGHEILAQQPSFFDSRPKTSNDSWRMTKV
jgi:hypothetical protein